jgi:hypothetical protein
LSAHRRPTVGDTASRGEPTVRRGARVPGRRRAAAPRNKSYRLVPVVLGGALLAIGAMAGPSVVGSGWNPGSGGPDRERITYASLPDDVPDQGLVYDGLVPAGPGSLCAGAYEIDDQTCTHGPDAAPAGLKVRRDVVPVTAKAPEPVAPVREPATVPPDAEIVRDEGGSALTAGKPALVPDAAPGNADFVMGNHDVACEGDGRSGNRVQVVYLHEFGTPSRFTDFVGSIRVWAAGVDAIYDASAAETGGSRHIRYVTTPSCRVDVAEVQVPEGSLTTFRKSIGSLQTLGYNRTDRKYLIFADAHVYCGISTYVADRRAGQGNRNNGGPAYGRVDAGCWSAAMAAHQLTHTLGAGLTDSPNATGAGGCTDDFDLLCGRDRTGEAIRTVCPKKHENRLDCGHDDYFSTNPKPGSYLARNWNVAQSEFLLRSDGGDDVPDAPGAVQPDTSAAPDPAPSSAAPADPPATARAGAQPADPPAGGDASDGGGDAVPPPGLPEPSTSAGPPADPAGEPAEPPAEEPVRAPAAAAAAKGVAPLAAAPVQAVLEVRDAASTSARLSWSAAGPDARYQVSVDGEPIAGTEATRARLIGLRPDAKYRIEIRSAGGYRAVGTAQTAPAGRPAKNSWFVLENSLTAGAADLYAARTANGTPIVLGGEDGDAQQQWKLVPAGAGTFALQSRATGKCVVPLGGNPVAGTPLVQGDCASDDRQRWSLQLSGHGFTLRTTVGDLVAGIGDQRFGAHRLLVLQNGNGSRHQSWTAVPG